MTLARLSATAPIAVLAMLALAGCSTGTTLEPIESAPSTPVESATPEPAESATVEPEAAPPSGPPSIDDLVIRPDGIGSLVIGTDQGLVDHERSLVRFVGGYCIGVEYDAGGTPLGINDDAWLPADVYLTDPGDPSTSVFSIGVFDGVVFGVDVSGDSPIATEEGIAAGSSEAEFLAAYPEAVLRVDGTISDVFEVRDGDHSLFFEVAEDPWVISVSPWPDVDRPVGIISARLHADYDARSRLATDDVMPTCF